MTQRILFVTAFLLVVARPGAAEVVSTPVADTLSTSVADTLPIPVEVRPDFVPAETVALGALLEEALKQNPTLAAARAAHEAATERPTWARSLPDPTVMGMVQNIGLDDFTVGDEMMAMAGVEFRQMFPNRAKREAASRFEAARAEGASAAVELRRASVAAAVWRTYAELAAVDRSAEVLARVRENARQIAAGVAASYRTGEAEQADLARAELEVSRTTSQLLALERRRRVLVARMNALLDRPAGTPLGTPEGIGWKATPRDPAAFLAVAEKRAPLLAASRASVKAAEERVARARAEYRPDWSLAAGAFSRGDLDPIVQAGVEISLPVRTASRQDPMLREAEALLLEARANLSAAQAEVRGAIEKALAVLETTEADLALYETALVPQARVNLRAALAAYRTGRVDFWTVIEALNRLERYEIERLETLARREAALADLAEVTGQIPLSRETEVNR